jgi:phosphoglucomutase/phosphomannomutase
MPLDREAALRGMTPLATRPEDAVAAVDAIQRWLARPQFEVYRPLLQALIDQRRWDALFEGFHRVLPFGTGGRRGSVGLGPNRINPWTLGTSVQGHIDFLRERFGDAALRVVVAADVRIFQDLRGRFPDGVENPLIGMRSMDLAAQAACIYAANGVDVHLLPPDGDLFMSTPELSFFIRRLGAQGGLNVSASHNHPDDNGGKFYTEHGAQEVPPHDERMVQLVSAVQDVLTMSWDEALATGKVHLLDGALHAAYLDEVSKVLRGTERGAKVVFTNLHGIGDLTAGEALERAGFDVHYVPEQRAHDGLFPGVKFRAPNPEYPSALAPAVELAKRIGADLVLGSDPDADRIGAMAPDPRDPDGPWRFFTGNELAALVASARFLGVPPGRIGIKTEVTTSLFSRVIRAAGGQVVDHLLVGCKYIAGVLRDLETTGVSGEVIGRLEDVLIGVEESHGFLLALDIRDKDSAAPALVLAEFVAERKVAGSDIVSALDEIYRKHGAVANVMEPLVMDGAMGRKRIEEIQAGLRSAPPTNIGGREVTAFFDRRDESGVFGPIVSESDRTSRDVLAFALGPDHRLVIRPSGTEPKTKIYVEAIHPVGDDDVVDEVLARARADAQALGRDFVQQALSIVGLDLSYVGAACSSLLSVENRIRFADVVLPAAWAEASAGASGADLRSFLQEEIGDWLGDGLAVCVGGYRAWRSGAGDLNERALASLDEAWAGV